MIRFRHFAFALVCLALGACKDARRDVARSYLQTYAPDGFSVVSIPDTLPVRDVSADTSELIVPVRYRSTQLMIERRNGFDLPTARAANARLAELRGWALSTLPADSPLRAQFLTAVASAQHAFPVKRIVSPVGTEVDALTTLTLRRMNGDWRVVEVKSDATVPGAPDADPTIPLENDPSVARRVSEMLFVGEKLNADRAAYVAARKKIAALSLARLEALLITGNTFTATLPDGTNLRLVVTHALEGGAAGSVVLTTQGLEQSAARFTGALEQKASGETVWRAAQITTLATPTLGAPPAPTDAAARPILTLQANGSDLVGDLKINGQPASQITFQPAGSVELLPDTAVQPSAVQ